MLKAAVISNHVEGIENMFKSSSKIEYSLIEITKDFDPSFAEYDILIVPNGCDNIAMYKIRNSVKKFLDNGKILFCFDGWFTNWVPGNTWYMNNDLKTIDIRYHIVHDTYKLFEGIDLNKFNLSHGISGWWACGYIETQYVENILLADTWDRAIIVIDEKSTAGIMVLTASAPMADMLFGTIQEEESAWDEIGKFYQKLIDFVTEKRSVLSN